MNDLRGRNKELENSITIERSNHRKVIDTIQRRLKIEGNVTFYLEDQRCSDLNPTPSVLPKVNSNRILAPLRDFSYLILPSIKYEKGQLLTWNDAMRWEGEWDKS